MISIHKLRFAFAFEYRAEFSANDIKAAPWDDINFRF